MRVKIQYCFCTYLLVALLSESSGQNNITQHTTTQNDPQEINITTTASGTTLRPNASSEQTHRFGNNSTAVPQVYTNGNKANEEYTSTAFDETSKSGSEYEQLNDTGLVDEDRRSVNSTHLNNTDLTEQKNNTGGALVTEDTDTPTMTSLPGSDNNKASSTAGYVILILILLLVLGLLVVLVYMRRVTRTYSFDLQRPAPTRTHEPIGSFEPVYLDDLDYQIHTVEAADDPNGTVLSIEDKEPSEKAENEESKANGVQTPAPPESSPGETEPDLDHPDHTDLRNHDERPSPVLFIHEEEDEASANNSPEVRSRSPFVEISLDDPQQLSASSVQPFSPSIFSSTP